MRNANRRPRPARCARLAAVCAAVALALGASLPCAAQTSADVAARSAQDARLGKARAPRPPASPSSSSSAAICLTCDRLYASDCNAGLWEIEPYIGTSTFLGPVPATLFDVALTPEGRLFGMDSAAVLYEVDLCTGVADVRGTLAGNGLGGDLATNDLFAQGPPLTRTETATYGTTTVGGTIGVGFGEWCNVSSGDVAMQPSTGDLYSSIVSVLLARRNLCMSCLGDVLLRVSPTTGEVLQEIGCLVTTTGQPLDTVYGLAFDSAGTLWGVRGTVSPTLLQIDPATAVATVRPLSGGFNCGLGLASLPCP